MSIILLRGYSHSGKDFIGNYLCKEYNYTRFAFADSLKKHISNNFNCPIELLHSQDGKKTICEADLLKRTYRQILIDEALRLRNIDIDVFAKECCKDILKSGLSNIVITDWRYSNEIDVIKNMFPDFKIIPVHIIRINQQKSPVDDISEYQLNDRVDDYILYNNMNDTIYSEIQKLIQYTNSYTINIL